MVLENTCQDEDEEWAIEGNLYVRFRRLRKGTGQWFRIRLSEFFKTVAAEVAQNTSQSRFVGKESERTNTHRTTTLNKLTRRNTPEQNYEK